MADGGAPELREVDPALIDPDPGNPRRSSAAEVFDISDIAASIREHGIIDALTVGPPVGGRYPLRHGERRLCAALATGRATVPVIIGPPLTAAEVLAQQLLTNTHTPYAPLCEARAYKRLLEEHRGDVGEVAAVLGRSPRLVRQRLVLLALVPEAAELLATNAITLGLALDLVALSPPAQTKVVGDMKRERREGAEPMTAREVSWLLRQARLRLVDAGFPLGDARLVPAAGPCTTCPKRSGVQKELFADGIDDEQLCSDGVCFADKRAAQAVRVTAAAKASGVPVVEKAGEVKKLFPYGRRLAHDAVVVELDEQCDLVRPPAGDAVKNLGRSGGPEKCVSGDGHDFEQGLEWSAEHDDEPADDDGGDGRARKEARAAGCAAWVTCDSGCGAWQEVDARPGAPPPGWKPPTWREALGAAIAKAKASPCAAEAQLVAIVEGQAVELTDKRAAVKLLQQAGVLSAGDARNEIRSVSPPRKPGELDKHELDQKARADAENEALGLIVGKATKAVPTIKWWRFFAGLVLRQGHELDEAIARRDLKPEKGKGKYDSGPAEKALFAWIATAEEGPLRGLAVELLASGFGHDSSTVAARYYGIDLDALTAAARERIKAEAKQKGKDAAAKASKKKAAPIPTDACGSAPTSSVAKGEPSACPLTWADVEMLAKPLKIKPHKGAQAPENVWHVVKAIRARTANGPGVSTEEIARSALHTDYASSGTDTVDLAIAVLMGLDRYTLRKGLAHLGSQGRRPDDVLCRPEPAPAPKASCAVCGCTDQAACIDEATATDTAFGECVLVDGVCSVCARCMAQALALCAKKQSESALLKALVTAQKGARAPEVWDQARASASIKRLVDTGAIGRLTAGKLLASQPPTA